MSMIGKDGRVLWYLSSAATIANALGESDHIANVANIDTVDEQIEQLVIALVELEHTERYDMAGGRAYVIDLAIIVLGRYLTH